MSRIGKTSVEIPSGAEVSVNGRGIPVKGPKGTLNLAIATPTTAKVEGNEVAITCANDEREFCSLHGLTRTLVTNMIEGVTERYTKVLEIQGTGYRVIQKGAALEFALGLSHLVNVELPEGITFRVEGSRVTAEGISEEQVEEVAANICKVRPPEPYRGKGMRYLSENIRRKVGKAGK